MGALWNCITRPIPSRTARGGAAMKQLEVGDRVKILDGGEDDEGTVLDVDEQTEMVIVYLGRHVGGRAFHRDHPAESQGALTKAQGRCTRDGPPSSLFHAEI